MFDLWSQVIASLPYSWAQYTFMHNALLAVLIMAPVFTLLGTVVVNNRMAFFSDTLGHSALTGIALGVVAHFADPLWSMLIFAIFVALGVAYIKRRTGASADTVIGAVSATAVALGVVILSKGGGFARYTRYLVGDLLSIQPGEITALFCVLIGIIILWHFIFNQLLLVSINTSLAGSRGVKTGLIEALYSVCLAVVVTFTLQWIGILIINALLVLPAAAARNLSHGMKAYHGVTFTLTLVCGITGLLLSYYWDTATGATIVLLTALCYLFSLVFTHRFR